MAYRFRPRQTYSFTISGAVKSRGELVILPQEPGNYEPNWVHYDCNSNAYVYLPGGISLEISASLEDTGGCQIDYENYWECDPDPNRTAHVVTTFTLYGVGESNISDTVVAADVGCTKVYGYDEGIPITMQCVRADWDHYATFSLTVSFEAETWIEYYDIAGGIFPCFCHQKDINNNWFYAPCQADLWCKYPLDKDPCWLPSRRGEVWIETGNPVTINYDLTVVDQNYSGSVTKATALINPGVMSGWLACSNTFPEGMTPLEMGNLSFARGGQASPNWEACEYTSGGHVFASVSGATYKIYGFPGSEGITTNSLLFTDYCGSFGHGYNGPVKYVDGQNVAGIGLHTSDQVPTWHQDTHEWYSDDNGADWLSPNDATLDFQGWWTLEGMPSDATGPYVKTVWDTGLGHNVTFAEVRAVNVWDRGDHDYYCTVGDVSIPSPGLYGQPEYPCADPAHPYEEGGCAHTDYKDSRVLGKVVDIEAAWDALQFSVPTSRKAYDINRTVNAVEGADSLTINGLEAISLWGSRYITLEFESTDVDKTPFILVLDGKEYKVSESFVWIDLLCPTNYSGVGISDSLIPIDKPVEASHGTSVPWDLGVYGINTLEIKGLKHGCSYTFTSITQRKKAHADGGSFVVLVMPQASWTGTAASPTRNPEVDTFVAEDAGISPTAHHNPHIWYQPSGLIFVDGMLAGEIIQTQFLKTPDEPCGDGVTTGEVWSVVAPNCDSAAFANYHGSLGSFVTVINPETPSGCTNQIGFLNPGLYGDWSKPDTDPTCYVITVSATLRLDWIDTPLAFGSMSWNVEKYLNGVAAIRVIDSSGGSGPFPVELQQTVNGSLKTVNVSTDKCGLAFTWSNTTTKSLYNGCEATVTTNINGAEVSGLLEVRNRKCSVGALKTGGNLSLKYCQATNKIVLTPNGKPALTCCN